MKLNFDFPIKDLNGQNIKENGQEVHFYKILGMSIMSPEIKIGDVIKKFNLATKIYNDKEVDVDDADLQILKEIVKTSNVFVPLVQAQLLIYLNSIK